MTLSHTGGAGFYGLRLNGVPQLDAYGTAAPAGWLDWSIEHEVRIPPSLRPQIDEDRSSAELAPGVWAVSLRGTSTTTFYSTEPPSSDQLAHPFLALTGALAARWRGDQAFHAGAFVHEGRAWAILGGREAGKSTMLAALSQLGQAIVADDLLTFRGDKVCAGPRCLDLRRPAAQRLGIGRMVAESDHRERFRVDLAPVSAEVPLAGWIALEWGQDFSVAAAPLSDLLDLLTQSFAILLRPPNPAGLLDFVGLPLLRVRRPRDLSAVDRRAAQLLDAVGAFSR